MLGSSGRTILAAISPRTREKSTLSETTASLSFQPRFFFVVAATAGEGFSMWES
ncbi:hypothetical protein HY251_12030 [bacterium]|nr:hypothetical protein [bacterium]